MAFATAYADSDADDEYERSVMTSPILHTDDDTSPTESDPPSTEPTPTFGRSDTERLSPGSLILEWTTAQCADFVSSLGPGLPQYRERFTGKTVIMWIPGEGKLLTIRRRRERNSWRSHSGT